ncbi:MAG: U32 family peptidase, partial [Spirochaetaceae bacterium]|nr:U32 family peptidase [Spirochaetaceae bacterium]
MKLPELLAPAGTPECLDAAVGCGADAVYLGLKSFNARLRSANFSYAQYEAALRSLHKTGRKLYVAVNTVFQERESDRVYQLLQYLEKTGADGVIVQDLGVLKMIHDFFPALAVHASTQMNISSAHGANVLSKYGVRRVVLARELSLEEIAGVASGSSVEMEVFVHGALCLSASGLCLFSSFLGGKSANRGMCTQACRRQYSAGEEAAGYYFSPPDLQLLGSVRELAETGVAALKIEGRMKSAEYVAAVTSAYRRVLDALASDSEEQYERALKEGERLLRADFARAKTNYRISGGAENPPERWLNPAQSGGAGIYLGAVRKTSTRGGICRVWLPGTEHTLEAGDTIRVHSAGDTRRVTHKITSAEPAPSGGERGQWLSAPEGVREGDEVYVIQKKAKHRYAPVLPRDLSPYKKQPGFDSAPPPNQSPCRS